MAAKKSPGSERSAPAKSAAASGSTTSARSTVGGPARKNGRSAAGALDQKMEGTDALAAAMPFNANKAGEYGNAAGQPRAGATIDAADPRVTASTLSEAFSSAKAGGGKPKLGLNPGNLPLDRVRVDSTDQRLTTNQGVPVADNQNSLKAGPRGPALLEDFILREKSPCKARTVRRSLHASHALLEQPNPGREGAYSSWLSLRVDEGAGAGDTPARRIDVGQRGRGAC